MEDIREIIEKELNGMVSDREMYIKGLLTFTELEELLREREKKVRALATAFKEIILP